MSGLGLRFYLQGLDSLEETAGPMLWTLLSVNSLIQGRGCAHPSRPPSSPERRDPGSTEATQLCGRATPTPRTSGSAFRLSCHFTLPLVLEVSGGWAELTVWELSMAPGQRRPPRGRRPLSGSLRVRGTSTRGLGKRERAWPVLGTPGWFYVKLLLTWLCG